MKLNNERIIAIHKSLWSCGSSNKPIFIMQPSEFHNGGRLTYSICLTGMQVRAAVFDSFLSPNSFFHLLQNRIVDASVVRTKASHNVIRNSECYYFDSDAVASIKRLWGELEELGSTTAVGGLCGGANSCGERVGLMLRLLLAEALRDVGGDTVLHYNLVQLEPTVKNGIDISDAIAFSVVFSPDIYIQMAVFREREDYVLYGRSVVGGSEICFKDTTDYAQGLLVSTVALKALDRHFQRFVGGISGLVTVG